MDENNKVELSLSPEEWEKMRETFNNPIGFKCWDCGKEITGLEVDKNKYRKSPVNHEGYIMLLCGCEED